MNKHVSCTYYLLILMVLGSAFAYRDPAIIERMTRFEAEMTICFAEYSTHFGLNGKDLKLSFDDLGQKFPTFKDTILFIADAIHAEQDSLNKKLEDATELASKIYEYAVRTYLLGTDNNGVIYHNFCHGMFVAYITREFISEYNLTTFKKMTKRTHAMYVFAGLFHDAGHPGMGNAIYKTSKTNRESMIIWIATRMDEVLPDPENKDVYFAKNKISEFYFKGKDFVLEDIHTTLALLTFDRLLAPYIAHEKIKEFQHIISESIKYTLMGLSYKECDHHLHYVVHAADLALNGTNNPELLFHAVRTVMAEFMDEAHKLASAPETKDSVETYLLTKQFDEQNTPAWKGTLDLAAPQTFGGIFIGQNAFRDYVINPTFKPFLIYDTDIFKYLSINLSLNEALFNSIGDYLDKGKITASSDAGRRFAIYTKYAELKSLDPLTFSKNVYANLKSYTNFKDYEEQINIPSTFKVENVNEPENAGDEIENNRIVL